MIFNVPEASGATPPLGARVWRYDYQNGAVHVRPINDAIAHWESEDCPCGSSVEHIERDGGGDAWMYIHHSLDGREASE